MPEPNGQVFAKQAGIRLKYPPADFFPDRLAPWRSGYILDITRGNYTLVFSCLGLMPLIRPRREGGCKL